MYVHTYTLQVLSPLSLSSVASKYCHMSVIICMVSTNNERCKKYSPMYQSVLGNTGCFIMFSLITSIYNKKTKGPTLMELFTVTGKQLFFFF